MKTLRFVIKFVLMTTISVFLVAAGGPNACTAVSGKDCTKCIEGDIDAKLADAMNIAGETSSSVVCGDCQYSNRMVANYRGEFVYLTVSQKAAIDDIYTDIDTLLAKLYAKYEAEDTAAIKSYLLELYNDKKSSLGFVKIAGSNLLSLISALTGGTNGLEDFLNNVVDSVSYEELKDGCQNSDNAAMKVMLCTGQLTKIAKDCSSSGNANAITSSDATTCFTSSNNNYNSSDVATAVENACSGTIGVDDFDEKCDEFNAAAANSNNSGSDLLEQILSGT